MTAAPPDAFGPAEFAAAAGASPAAVAEVERFRSLLEDWSGRMNLVGPSALAQFWRRHAYDSAQLLALAPGAKVWADVGAGAGFPGVVLAILLKEHPGSRVHLVESLQKRCRFLSAVVDELQLPAVVHNTSSEAVKLGRLDVVTARAVAPLDRLLGLTRNLLTGRAVGLFLKGRNVEAELTEAAKTWTFRHTLTPSLSDPEGRVLRIWSVAHAPA
ncbi:MAG: 16S rRNA (guanine(527)-N(7))-methyltransferase RsmG [Pseudomonadota bacterium]|nr:16S rRNA (guanine(527)-N(7))-methyltransferase RsmG [Pseudomonadota bacterium]